MNDFDLTKPRKWNWHKGNAHPKYPGPRLRRMAHMGGLLLAYYVDRSGQMWIASRDA